MALKGDEKYVTVHGTLAGRTKKAIRVETVTGSGWVPRSCIHFSTDKAVDDMDVGDEAEFKIMQWVADDRGLV